MHLSATSTCLTLRMSFGSLSLLGVRSSDISWRAGVGSTAGLSCADRPYGGNPASPTAWNIQSPTRTVGVSFLEHPTK